uniref:Secreted protein n=1 Tax=Meloidogyne floridensis TaxID=298350 RepID=A0A915NS98_9BILA
MYSSTLCFLFVVALIAQIVDLAPPPAPAKQFRVKRARCYNYNIRTQQCRNPRCPRCPASSSMSSRNPNIATCCY